MILYMIIEIKDSERTNHKMCDLKKNFRTLVPYTPGDQPQFRDKVKLNTNENPYPPSKCVEKAMSELKYEDFKLYPDPTANELVEAIAKHHKVSADMVFAGVGSDDVIATCFMAFFNSGKPVLFPDITYAFYDVWANLFNIKFNTPKVTDDFKIRKEDYYTDNGGIIFPNPNAPTGILMPLSEIENVLAHNKDVIVIIDEAYIDFGGQSAIALIEKYKNLVVTRTFSKSRSMAGMRIGYAVADSALIKELNTVKYSYNSYTLNLPSIKLGKAAIEDNEYFKETVDKIVSTRERIKVRLKELGFSFPDSMSNFIFAKHNEIPAKEIFEALKENHIFVRYFNKDKIDNYLRITIGTDEEMDILIAFLDDYIKRYRE